MRRRSWSRSETARTRRGRATTGSSPTAAPEAFARADYQLEVEQAERAAQRPGSSLWLGPEDALAQFGVRRGEAIEREQLIAVLQGQHVQTGEQLRRPGSLKREARDENGEALLDEQGRPVIEKVNGVAHVEMTLSVPKSVSVLWAMADDQDRASGRECAARGGGADGAVHGA